MVLGEIVAGIEAINKVLDAPLKARTAFRLGRLSKELSPHFETYEKVRQELLEKFGEKVLIFRHFFETFEIFFKLIFPKIKKNL